MDDLHSGRKLDTVSGMRPSILLLLLALAACPGAEICDADDPGIYAYTVELVDLDTCDEITVVGPDDTETHCDGPYEPGSMVRTRLVPYAVYCDGNRVRRKIVRSLAECETWEIPCQDAPW